LDSYIPAMKKQTTEPDVYEQVKDKILSGTVNIGEKLVTQQLADYLGVSRTPVREALARLESEGLVIRGANQGYSVRRLTLKDATSLFEARMVIEVANAKFAASRAGNAALSAMQNKLAEASRHLSANELGAFQKAARGFHQLIATSTENEQLQRMFNQINDMVILFGITLIRSSPARAQEIERENQRIFQAIQAGDATRAAEAMQGHLNCAYDHFKRSIPGLAIALDLEPIAATGDYA